MAGSYGKEASKVKTLEAKANKMGAGRSKKSKKGY